MSGSIYGPLIGLVPALVVPLLLLRRRWGEILTVHSPGFAVMGHDAADVPVAVMNVAPPPIAARAATPAAAAASANHSAPPANVV